MSLIYTIVSSLLALLILAAEGFALPVPPNDECSGAHVINVPANGFAIGSYRSDTINIDPATLSALPVPPSVAGNMDKDMWFRFSLPTKRKITYAVRQPSNNIANNRVSFVLYDTAGCPVPSTQPHPALPPKNSFSSRTKDCMKPGVYYLRVGVPNSVPATPTPNIFVELTISNGTNGNPPPMPFDFPSNRQQLGLINSQQTTNVFAVTCHSIDDTTEKCPAVLSNPDEYTQSTWHTFQTDSYLDYLGIQLQPASNPPAFTNATFGYRLYQGDVQNAPPSNLSIVTSCKAIDFSPTQIARQEYFCGELQPNTTYSIQLLYQTGLSGDIDLTVHQLGIDSAQAPRPDSGWMSVNNNFLGTIQPSQTGTFRSVTDYFGCNSRLNTNACGTANPAGGVTMAGTTYDLATWLYFQTDTLANLELLANHLAPSTNCRDIAVRIFRDTITNACADIDGASPFATTTNGNMLISCLPPGHYAVQLLGRTGNDVVDCSQSNFGRAFETILVVSGVEAENLYNLRTATRVDSINQYQALSNGMTYQANQDVFGCRNTVLPDDTICPGNTKASYRVLNIGDNIPGNAIPDSGVLTISNLNATDNLEYGFYKGNAQQLSINQNANSFPGFVSNLTPQKTSCAYANNYGQYQFCVTDNFYSFVTMADSQHVGVSDQPAFSLSAPQNAFNSPANAENLDTIGAGSYVISQGDEFSCVDNAIPLTGVNPCGPKAIYREFYLEAAANVEISSNQSAMLQIFNGRANNVQGVVNQTGFSGCSSGLGLSPCDYLSAGWYTVVSYGNGPSYAEPQYATGNGGDLGKAENITISTDTLSSGNYNRPHKACIVNGGAPLTYYTSAVGDAYPATHRIYNLCPEQFGCKDDAPLSAHGLSDSCGSNYNRVAYYQFDIAQESYVVIYNIPPSHHAQVYDFDVTTDSTKMDSVSPIQPCIAGIDDIRICRMQPGEYTLVVFADDSHIDDIIGPRVYVDVSDRSRFDSTANAYDFGAIPPDGQWYDGRPGGPANPLHSGRAPSNDFFYCTTGSTPSDPYKALANGTYNPNIYPDTKNNVLYYDTTNPREPRRNLWYTFKLRGNGIGKVKVNVFGQGLIDDYLFSIYKSNLPCGGSYDSLINTMTWNQIKAMKDQLQLVDSNYKFHSPLDPFQDSLLFSNCSGPNGCSRYFVLVENKPLFATNHWPNHQAEVEVSYDSAVLRYDHYADTDNQLTANVINGLQQTVAPYQDSLLDYGCYQGSPASFACATSDPYDPNWCGNRTLWYEFETDKTGRVRVNMEVLGSTNRVYDPADIMLLKQGQPNNPAGLDTLSLCTSNSSGLPWGETCIDSGKYYILLTGCHYNFATVRPHVCLEQIMGDHCETAITGTLNGIASASLATNIDCHSMGGDYGEDGSDMTCLDGPSGFKSTWYQVQVANPSNNYDIQFRISGNLNPVPSVSAPVEYRVLEGGPCVGNMNVVTCGSFGTGLTLTCRDTGTYYVQVTSPDSMLGDLVLDVSTSVNTNPNCHPGSDPVADFSSRTICETDSLAFENLSLHGASNSIRYLWIFHHNDDTVQAYEPTYAFPAGSVIDTYQVTLVIADTSTGEDSALTKPVVVYPSAQNLLGSDTAICRGDTLLLQAAYTAGGGSFIWQDSSSGPSFRVTQEGTYWVEDQAGCRDSVNVHVDSLPAESLTGQTACEGDTVSLHAQQGPYSYSWSTGDTGSTIDVTVPGAYRVDIVNGACQVRDSSFVRFDTIPQFSLGQDTTLCPGNALKFDLSGNGSVYEWSNGDNGPLASFQQEGTYSVRVTDGNGCGNTDTVDLDFFPAIDYNTVGKDPVCFGETNGRVAANTTAGGSLQYTWTDEQGNVLSADSLATGLGEGSYRLTILDSKGCEVQDTVRLNNPPALALSVESISSPSCHGRNDGMIQLSATGGTKPLSYSIDGGQAFSDSSAFSGLSAGSYSAVARDANGCRAQAGEPVVLREAPPISIRARPDSATIQPGGSKQLNAETGSNAAPPYQWTWSPGSGLSCVNCSGPVAQPDTSTHYIVKLDDSNGCVTEDTAFVEVVEGNRFLYVPNAFSPNDDGKNDVFRVYAGGVDEMQLRIFNRWGELVFEANDPSDTWDGAYNGRRAQSGTYVYTLSITFEDNDRIVKKGSITLLR